MVTITKLLITALEVVGLCTLAPLLINGHVPIVSGCCNRHEVEVTGNEDIKLNRQAYCNKNCTLGN